MDPLSVSSGVVGLVAFAIQMAKVASQVKQAVEQFKSAPKEMTELLEKLTLLETVCKLVGMKAASRPGLPSTSSSASVGVISTALLQCQHKMDSLSRTLSATGLHPSQIKTPLSKSEALSRLRFVLRREKVKSMVQDVDHVISHLQFAINVDMWMTATPGLQNSVVSYLDNVQGDVPRLPEETYNGSVNALQPSQAMVLPKRKVGKVTPETCRSSRYLGLVTWTTIEKQVEDQGDDVMLNTGRREIITIRLPFSSVRLDFHYAYCMGTPSYALNINHVIEPTSELGMKLSNIIIYKRDLLELKRLLTERKLSIYSLYGHSSLYQIAVGERWAQGCKYLLDHDFRQSFTEEELPKFYFSRSHSVSCGTTCEVTEMILSIRPRQTRFKDMVFLLNSSFHPRYLEIYLQRFLADSRSDSPRLVQLAWAKVSNDIVSMWTTDGNCVFNASKHVTIWSKLLRYLIENGADVHQPVMGDRSAYLEIMLKTEDPCIADECIQAWLYMLRSCGVAIRPYIDREIQIVHKFWEFHDRAFAIFCFGDERRLVAIDFEGIPAISWRWSQEREEAASAFELLKAFQDLIPRKIPWIEFLPQASDSADFRVWFASNVDEHTRWSNFPFMPTALDYVDGEKNFQYDGWLHYLEAYRMALDIRKQRLARREARKWRRSHPGEKLPTQKMPCSWMD